MNKGLQLPGEFFICYKNMELVRIQNSHGNMVGEVLEYDRYLTPYTDKMIWRDEDTRRWLMGRALPSNRTALKEGLELLGMDHWDLEEIIVKTRGFHLRDFYWVKLSPNERIEDLSPRYHEEWLPELISDEDGTLTIRYPMKSQGDGK